MRAVNWLVGFMSGRIVPRGIRAIWAVPRPPNSPLPLIEELEDKIGDLERRPEERELQDHGPHTVGLGHTLVVDDGLQALAVGVDAAEDEGGKDEGEEGGRVEVVAGAGEQQREGEAEAAEVGPAGLDEGEAALEVPGHVEPLVLEGVEGVEEGEVGVREQLGEPGDRDEGHEGALDEEDELEGAAEDGVGQGVAEGRLVGLVLFHALGVVLLEEGDVGYFGGDGVQHTNKSKFLHKKYNKIKKLGSAHKVIFFISRKSRVIISYKN